MSNDMPAYVQKENHHPSKVTIQLITAFAECNLSLIGASATIPRIADNIVYVAKHITNPL